MKKKWKDKRETIGNLNLDLKNPRVPKHIKDLKSEEAIRNYLIDKEGVLKIAENIAEKGYHKSVTSIACEEGGNLIVLDGNRRLAACQLLLNPSLAPPEYRKRLELLAKHCDKTTFKRVKVTIAPLRKDAEREIWDIHVSSLLKSWQVLQKLRVYRNLIEESKFKIQDAAAEHGLTASKIRSELAMLHFYEAILAQSPQSEEVLLDSGFNKIDRVILGKYGKQYLDYSVSDEGKVVAANQAEYDEKLKKIIPFIVQPSKVLAQANQEWIRKNVFAVLDAKKFSDKAAKRANASKPAKKKVGIHPKCFVIMPLSGLDDVYGSVKSAWKAVFGKRAKIFNQADDKSKGGKEFIDKKILRNISSSTVVVGILSMGTKEKLLHDAVPDAKKDVVFQNAYPINANVALEVGYSARCADEGLENLRDFFLIADNSGKHSAFEFVTARCFDLGHRDIVPYEESNLGKLEEDMREYFKDFKEKQNL